MGIAIPQIFALPTEHHHERHHRVIKYFPDWVKNEIVAGMSEFIGTVLFLMFAFGGTNVANVPADNSGNTSVNVTSGSNTTILLYIALCFGFSLTVNAWVFFRISGGLFNPYAL
jgi:aquaporin related protein